MKQEGWKGKDPQGKQVTFTCHETAPRLADITAQVEGKEALPCAPECAVPHYAQKVEKRFVAELNDEK